jgi:hypothetical protein
MARQAPGLARVNEPPNTPPVISWRMTGSGGEYKAVRQGLRGWICCAKDSWGWPGFGVQPE